MLSQPLIFAQSASSGSIHSPVLKRVIPTFLRSEIEPATIGGVKDKRLKSNLPLQRHLDRGETPKNPGNPGGVLDSQVLISNFDSFT